MKTPYKTLRKNCALGIGGAKDHLFFIFVLCFFGKFFYFISDYFFLFIVQKLVFVKKRKAFVGDFKIPFLVGQMTHFNTPFF